MFGARFAFIQQVADLRRENDGLALTLSDFGTVHARAIVLASGVSYRLLGIPALEDSMAPASSMADQRPKHPLWLTETSTSSAARTQPGRRPCIWHVMQRTSPWSCEPTRWPLVCPTI